MKTCFYMLNAENSFSSVGLIDSEGAVHKTKSYVHSI